MPASPCVVQPVSPFGKPRTWPARAGNHREHSQKVSNGMKSRLSLGNPIVRLLYQGREVSALIGWTTESGIAADRRNPPCVRYRRGPRPRETLISSMDNTWSPITEQRTSMEDDRARCSVIGDQVLSIDEIRVSRGRETASYSAREADCARPVPLLFLDSGRPSDQHQGTFTYLVQESNYGISRRIGGSFIPLLALLAVLTVGLPARAGQVLGFPNGLTGWTHGRVMPAP